MIDSFLKGFAISLLLVFSVGPLIFSVIKQSINNGKAGGFSFVAGIWLSDLIWAVLSNAFSSIVANLLHFEKEIGIFGSSLLITMGCYYLFIKKIKENPKELNISAGTHVKLFTSGFFINGLNPGLIIFWLTWATAFSTHTAFQRIIIFSTCLILNMAADVFKVTLADRLRTKLTVKNMSLINKISGSLLVGFGIALLVATFYTVVKHG